jgi:hypothetical protein
MSMIAKHSKITGTSQTGTRFQYRAKSLPSGWREIGAMLGLAGGLLSNLFGLILTAVAWFLSRGAIVSTVHDVGTVLLIINIPLLMGGAHCLDLVEKKKRIEVLTD